METPAPIQKKVFEENENAVSRIPVRGQERAPARGSAAVLYADGHLIFRYDRGEVLLIEASPEAMRIKGQFTPVTDEGPAWSHPVIYQGKLYLRHGNLLACYDLRAL